jgi:hypothetical protein
MGVEASKRNVLVLGIAYTELPARNVVIPMEEHRSTLIPK